jgi:hypothetical protein
MIDINRRSFLFGSAAAATLAGCSTAKVGARELKPGEKRNVAMIGIGIQGRFLLTEFLRQPNVRVVAICDVDKTRREDSAATVDKYYKDDSKCATALTVVGSATLPLFAFLLWKAAPAPCIFLAYLATEAAVFVMACVRYRYRENSKGFIVLNAGIWGAICFLVPGGTRK